MPILSPAEEDVLKALEDADDGQLHADEIAERSGRPKQVVWRICNRLGEKGYIEISRVPGDARKKVYRLTDEDP